MCPRRRGGVPQRACDDEAGCHTVPVGTTGATPCAREEDEGRHTVHMRMTTLYFSFLLHHLCSSLIYLIILHFFLLEYLIMLLKLKSTWQNTIS